MESLKSRLAQPHLIRWVFVIAAIVLCGIAVERTLYGTSDFDTFHKAGQMFWDDGRLRDDDSGPAVRYPPTFSLLMAPFGALPLAVACALWSLLSVLAAASLPRIFEKLLGVPPREQWLAWLTVMPFVVGIVLLGQNGLILLWMASMGLLLAREGRSILGGHMLFVATLLKVIPAPLLAIPILLRRIRGTVLGVAGTAAVAAVIFTVTLGSDDASESVEGWWARSRTENTPWAIIEAGHALRYKNQGLAVTLARTLGYVDPGRARGAVRLMTLPDLATKSLYWALAGTIGLTWMLCLWRSRRIPPRQAWGRMLALTFIAMLAASPIVWTHYFVWLLPALVAVQNRRRLMPWILALSTAALLIREARALGAHMILALVLFVLIAGDLLRSEEVTPEPSSPG